MSTSRRARADASRYAFRHRGMTMRPDRAASMRAGSAARFASRGGMRACSRRPLSSPPALRTPPIMNKVIRHVFPAAETGFDPAGVHDLYSATIEQAMFETLLTYDYLARPVEARAADRRGAAARSPTTARRTRSGSGRASTSRPIRRSRAAKRELIADGLRLFAQAPDRSEDALAVGVARRGQDRRPRRRWPRRRRRPASSTTTRRSRGSRRPTATRCASG